MSNTEFHTEIMAAGDADLRLDALLESEFAAAGWSTLPQQPPSAPDSTDSPAGAPVVLVLIDGLGWWNLNEYLGHAPNLRALVKAATASGQTLTARSVCPSTTAAAITSTLTGLAPGRHNMLSYQLIDPVAQAKFNLITFEDYPGRTEEFQPESTWFERLHAAKIPAFALGPKKFIGGGLTRAALRGATYVASENLEARAHDAANVSKQGGMTYFYIAEVDHAGHGYGVGSDKWVKNLEKADRAIGIMLDSLAPGVRVIITADHGMLNTSPEVTVDLAKTAAAEFIADASGEGRVLHVHAQPGAAAVLQETLQTLLGPAKVLNRDQAEALFAAYNGTPVRRKELLGDVVIFAAGTGQTLDSRFFKEQVFQMKGLHGGLSESEMRVPLLRYVS
ncbi:alkaline phosphatase family protein [Mobiluncus curtisii]|uniref:alkaline phosphatase family protein n=1 Tax=Mobiluncus curtisii TaxID=2051 RepID=UPI001F366479|nr:alkaline phosphatase family protein [Mobiluncus curtisii]